jgi:hypothetical protein
MMPEIESKTPDDIELGPTQLNASKIPVSRMRHIITWPLVLEFDSRDVRNSAEQRESAFTTVLKSIHEQGSPWRREQDLSKYASPPQNTIDPDKYPSGFERHSDKAQRYAEFVYFHDFVQSTLYTQDAKETPAALFVRDDIKRVEFEIESVKEPMRLNAGVERITLHVFKTGAAMLTVELEYGLVPEITSFKDGAWIKRKLSLADAQTATDFVRRAYAPYFSLEYQTDEKPKVTIAKVLANMRWLNAQGNSVFSSAPAEAAPKGEAKVDAFLDQKLAELEDGRFPKQRKVPVLDHWRNLIAPLAIAGEDTPFGTPRFRQVADDRMPLMTYIHLPDELCSSAAIHNPLQVVKPGDWMRLCYADEAGNSIYPYFPGFLENFEQECCYDRFFPSKDTDHAYGTRFMFSGYHFCVVTSGDFGANDVAHHFRRHYYQISLIVQMEIATLLSTSSQISASVRRYGKPTVEGGGKKRLAQDLKDAEGSFLQYTHLFHFSGLSSQLQPTEMFEMWRKSAGLPQLYEEVRSEVSAGNQFLTTNEAQETADASNRLNTIAMFGVVLGLVFSFFGMNILVQSNDSISPWLAKWNQISILGVATILIVFGLFVFSRVLDCINGKPADSRLLTTMAGIFLVGSFVCVVGYVAG